MKKYYVLIACMVLTAVIVFTGCSAADPSAAEASVTTEVTASGGIGSTASDLPEAENESAIPASTATELEVRFGDDGAPFTMHLEDNETAAAIAGHVGTSDWRLPIYNYDESDVMQYYDIPNRYEIPATPETVTSAKAGEVYYSDPNRIVLYYGDAEISEEYVKIGQFDTTEEFSQAVIGNPVLEGWSNKIVLISSVD